MAALHGLKESHSSRVADDHCISRVATKHRVVGESDVDNVVCSYEIQNSYYIQEWFKRYAISALFACCNAWSKSLGAGASDTATGPV